MSREIETLTRLDEAMYPYEFFQLGHDDMPQPLYGHGERIARTLKGLHGKASLTVTKKQEDVEVVHVSGRAAKADTAVGRSVEHRTILTVTGPGVDIALTRANQRWWAEPGTAWPGLRYRQVLALTRPMCLPEWKAFRQHLEQKALDEWGHIPKDIAAWWRVLDSLNENGWESVEGSDRRQRWTPAEQDARMRPVLDKAWPVAARPND